MPRKPANTRRPRLSQATTRLTVAPAARSAPRSALRPPPRNLSRASPRRNRLRRSLPKTPVQSGLRPNRPLWLRFGVGLVLLLVALVTTQASSAVVLQHNWRSPEFLWLALGSLGCSFAVLVAPARMQFAYVFAHELTHVCFAYLCGGKAEEAFRVSSRGGHVVTTKTNWLISLSPYFFPFYTMIGLLAFALCALLVSPGPGAVLALHAFLGLTLTLHAGFTMRVLLRNQPDLRMNGVFFSLLIIYLVNLLLVTALLVAVSPERSFAGYLEDWSDTFDGVLRFLLLIFARSVD